MKHTVNIWKPQGLAGVECLRAEHVGVRFARHFHEGYAVGVIESGALGFKYLGRDCVAPAGAVNMVVPGEVHDGHPESPQGWGYRMFYLDAPVVEKLAGEMDERDAKVPDFPAGVIHDPLLAGGLRLLHEDLEAGRTTLLERQSRLAAILAAWISRHSGRAERLYPGAEPRAVSRAKDYLRQRAVIPVSLEELSREAGLSGFRLNRLFSLHVGLPPHAYQVMLRVENARALIAAGSNPAQAALESGFSDQSHLTRHFRRMTGLTPGAYGKIVQDR
ncbi:AraC family transcriptional regulator [Fundidesulfovibrio terrae]|uniref:AraC family transcriptional regulator n=1 Tax=Fundidesulfovibrio terrae TaxID=2922866 RepID=UPI001FAF2AA3